MSGAGGETVSAEATLSRRERRRLEIRERVLETGRALFERQGYEATTVGEIAEQADIAYGTFFKHFPSKLELLRALSDRALSELFDDVESLRRSGRPFADQLVELFEATARRAEEMPQRRDLLGAMISLAYPETAARSDQRMHEAFRVFLRDGFERGELRQDVDREAITEIVVGAWYSTFTSWIHFDDYPLRDRASQVAHFLAESLAPRQAD